LIQLNFGLTLIGLRLVEKNALQQNG